MHHLSVAYPGGPQQKFVGNSSLRLGSSILEWMKFRNASWTWSVADQAGQMSTASTRVSQPAKELKERRG